ncbi:N-acetylmuramoyl-L-alanine amidase, partial [Pelagibacteraceae bacterium]|nr:N-acetylmuramoyl-L-alanine amidase [Pelagibacteraceae bacterium]
MKKIISLSPNCSQKTRPINHIKFIIIHYTGMQSEIESINRLMNIKSKVSCHYLINRKGTILQMVPDNKISWHAGKSKWKSFQNLNNNSIGIELVNKGHEFGYE